MIGEIIRRQRELAELSMRQVAAMAGISNPYLSQIEHGGCARPQLMCWRRSPRHWASHPLPCVRTRVMIMRQQLTLITKGTGHPVTMSTVAAISTDPGLTARQRRALTGDLHRDDRGHRGSTEPAKRIRTPWRSISNQPMSRSATQIPTFFHQWSGPGWRLQSPYPVTPGTASMG